MLERFPETYVLAFDPEQMGVHEELLAQAPTVRCVREDGHVTVTIAAQDRPGLLATLAGALTVCGLDVLEANLLGTTDGIALDVFRVADPFGRVDDDGARVADTIGQALAGALDLATRVNERRRAYASAGTEPGPVAIVVDNDASETDTIVEVHADDDVGLLYRLASAFAELGLDVRIAKVATLGTRVVDVFYVRAADGRKLEEDMTNRGRAALTSRISG